MIFVQLFYDNFYDNFLFYTYILCLLSLSIASIFVHISTFLCISLGITKVVPQIDVQITYILKKSYVKQM